MSISHKDFDEKRNFIRMKIDTSATITVASKETQMQGVCRDLSGGGMLIETNTPLDLGVEVNITITSNHGHSPMLKARSTVTRCATQGEGQYLLGFEVIEMLD